MQTELAGVSAKYVPEQINLTVCQSVFWCISRRSKCQVGCMGSGRCDVAIGPVFLTASET